MPRDDTGPRDTRQDTAARRAELMAALFPGGIPTLWCPPLTHYRADGSIDRERGAAHLAFLTQWAKGLLVPGSTGDGWELTPEESEEVIDLAAAEAGSLGVHVLCGSLHPDATEAERHIRATRMRLIAQDGLRGHATRDGLATAVFGFAVCPPRGADLTQREMELALCRILDNGEPLALYQLPQVTENEMSPELIFDLAGRFANFILFKDTSDTDRVAGAGLDLNGVFLVRGAEGGYAPNLKASGGGYDGLLLSTANSFGETLSRIIALSTQGEREEARRLSDRVSSLMDDVLRLVATLPQGNVFTNSAKAVDHYFAHGPRVADTAPPPRLHAGSTLPREVLRATGSALARYGLMPQRGYME